MQTSARRGLLLALLATGACTSGPADKAQLAVSRTVECNRFAGLIAFFAEERGTYAILIASMAWADVGEPSPLRLIEAQSFKWIDVCGKKYKSGLYALEGGKAYFVQLWDSPDRELAMMIRKLP